MSDSEVSHEPVKIESPKVAFFDPVVTPEPEITEAPPGELGFVEAPRLVSSLKRSRKVSNPIRMTIISTAPTSVMQSVTLPIIPDITNTAIIETLYNNIKTNIKDFSKLTAPEITQMITIAMGSTKQFSTMPGSTKSLIVCKVAEMLVNDMPEGEMKVSAQVMLVFLPSLISNIVEYAKGKFDLNGDGVVTNEEVKTKCASIFSCFNCRKS